MGLAPESAIWKDIDLSESYLVCCMFEDAASLSKSIVKNIHSAASMDAINETPLAEMLESASMVLVQSLKEMGRTSELFVELQVLFGSVTAIPVHVFLTGACMQISEGFSSNLKPILEEFLGMWKFFNDELYVLPNEQPKSLSFDGCPRHSFMHVDEYLELSELYAVTLLGTALCNPVLAISWIERAELPEERRQEMLRRLHSLQLPKETTSSWVPGTSQITKKTSHLSVSGTASTVSGECLPTSVKAQSYPNGDISKPPALKSIHPTIERMTDWFNSCFWRRCTVHLNFGHVQFVQPRGKIILLGSFMALAYYVLRKRRATMKWVVVSQALSIRKALVDAWQLAFSVQLNPLAAVQPLPSASRGSR